MPNFTRTQPDATWVDGYQIPAADLESLAAKVFSAINGDRGGTYIGHAPDHDSTLEIGGSGLQLTGPLKLRRGGRIEISGTSRYYLEDATFPQLATTHALRTRKIVTPATTFRSPKPYLWASASGCVGIGSVGLAVRNASTPIEQSGTRNPFPFVAREEIDRPEMYIPLRVHDGGKLSAVEVHFRVALPRVRPPNEMPKFRVLRFPLTGTPTPESLNSAGYASPDVVSSGPAWYNGGEPQSFTFDCDQNNTIDTSLYNYVLHVVEERGAETPQDEFDGIALVERKADVMVSTSTDPTSSGGVGICDGAFTPILQRYLVIDSEATLESNDFTSPKNGIWIGATAAPSTRANDLNDPSHFTPGALIFVKLGVVSGGTIFQIDRPTSNQAIVVSDDALSTDTPIRLQPAEPRGNIYHSAVCTFELTDLRFQ